MHRSEGKKGSVTYDTGTVVVDWEVFVRNRALFTPEMLAPYANHWVAWSLEGSAIIAHSADPNELDRVLNEMGLPRDGYLLSYVDPLEACCQL